MILTRKSFQIREMVSYGTADSKIAVATGDQEK